MRAIVGDPGELLRFVLSGAAATVANVTVEMLLRPSMSFEAAVVPGVATGFVVSFTLSKFFAFRSRSWQRAPGELARFMVVYAIGALTFWTIAVLIGRIGAIAGLGRQAVELAAMLFGAGSMAATSYLGHRFFTYRIDRDPLPTA